MNTFRWIALLPASLLASFAGFWLLSHFEIHQLYSKHHIFRSVIWLAPSFFIAATPCALFVVTAAIVAPRKKRIVAMIAALFAFMTALQFALVTLSGYLVFDLLSIAAPFFGAIIAVAFACWLDAHTKTKHA